MSQPKSDFPNFVIAILCMVATFWGIWISYWCLTYFVELRTAEKLVEQVQQSVGSLNDFEAIEKLRVGLDEEHARQIVVTGLVDNLSTLQLIQTRLKELGTSRCDVTWDVEVKTVSAERVFNSGLKFRGGSRVIEPTLVFLFAFCAAAGAFVVVLKQSINSLE